MVATQISTTTEVTDEQFKQMTAQLIDDLEATLAEAAIKPAVRYALTNGLRMTDGRTPSAQYAHVNAMCATVTAKLIDAS